MLFKALLSFFLVLIVGYLGCFLDVAGCILGVSATATGCIVYAIYDSRK
ncbi:hypothetical protein HMPREF0866_01269 [Ruminococcaceae bacterium D16]|nr:hypothetical protein HMPREF0866_01269 [Ruminococcaceae bacterium D16]